MGVTVFLIFWGIYKDRKDKSKIMEAGYDKKIPSDSIQGQVIPCQAMNLSYEAGIPKDSEDTINSIKIKQEPLTSAIFSTSYIVLMKSLESNPY